MSTCNSVNVFLGMFETFQSAKGDFLFYLNQNFLLTSSWKHSGNSLNYHVKKKPATAESRNFVSSTVPLMLRVLFKANFKTFHRIGSAKSQYRTPLYLHVLVFEQKLKRFSSFTFSQAAT